MENLIKALQIFLKYENKSYPTHCEHDVLYVVGYNIDDFKEDDIKELNGLGFTYDFEEDLWYSYKYGSC